MRSWMAGYPFRLIRSSRGMLNCQACPDFDYELSSFRDGPQDQTRNLEIPGSMLCIAPE